VSVSSPGDGEGVQSLVTTARAVVTSGSFLTFTRNELLTWYAINGHLLMVEQVLAVGDVLRELQELASLLVDPPAHRPAAVSDLNPVAGVTGNAVADVPIPVLAGPGKSAADDACVFLCFDGFSHRTNSRSPSVLSAFARDYNVNIAYWRLLRFEERSEAISLVTAPTNTHALFAGSLRSWITYYTPLAPAERHRFFRGSTSGLLLLRDLGFLEKVDDFASLMSLNWGVQPLAGSKPLLSARDFMSSSGDISVRRTAFDDAVRADLLRTVDAVHILKNWVTCLSVVTLNPQILVSFTSHDVEGIFAISCETLNPVVSLMLIWRSIATTTDSLRSDRSAAVDSDSVSDLATYSVFRSRSAVITDWFMSRLVSSLALPTGGFYDAGRSSRSARDYFLDFAPAPATRVNPFQAQRPDSSAKVAPSTLPCAYAYLAKFHPSLSIACTSGNCSFTHEFDTRASSLDAVRKVVSNVRSETVLGSRRKDILEALDI